MWQRLEREAAHAPRGAFRPAWWGVPLAAAAVLALVWYSSLSGTSPTAPLGPPPGGDVASAPEAAVPPNGAARAVARAKSAAEAAPVRQANADLAPEDLPPEVVEHPELFLRLPVVRRLEKLEHFEEVRMREQSEPLGRVESRSTALG